MKVVAVKLARFPEPPITQNGTGCDRTMKDMKNMKEAKKALMILRVFLFCSGFGWVISVFGIFMPWSFVAGQMQGLGAENVPSDPMFNYWLRMTAAAFTFIGLFFIVLGVRPHKYSVMIPFAAGFLFFEGLVLLGACLVLHLSLLPSVFDSIFCLFMAAGIFLSNRAVGNYTDKKESPSAMAVEIDSSLCSE